MMCKKQLSLCLVLLGAFTVTQAADDGPLDAFERDVAEPEYLDTSEREVEQPETMDMDDQNPAKCMKGWVERAGYCYFRTTTTNGFDNTEKHCASLHEGGHLASVKSQKEFDFIKKTFGTDKPGDEFWIGLRDVKKGAKPRKWEWTDGSAYGYSNWHPKQPDDHNGVEDCVHMHKGNEFTWNDHVCTRKINGICKYRIPKCMKGWVERAGHCYLRTTTSNGFGSMEKHCASLHKGGHLASVQSQQEFDFIKKTFGTDKRGDQFWIGLRDVKNGAKPRKWEWTDGSAYRYSNWHPKQPDDHNGVEDCVHMHKANDYTWNDYVCARKINAICKYRIVKCQDGWVQLGDNCYFRTSTSDGFVKTESHCSSLHKGAHLTSVHSQQEFDFIKKTFGTDKRGDEFWIGLRDVGSGAKPRKWQWTDGSAYNYKNWKSGQPDDHAGQEDCAHMHQGNAFQWNDHVCWRRINGICKYNFYY